MATTQKRRGRARVPDTDKAENKNILERVQKGPWEDPACDTRADNGDQSIELTKKYEQISWIWANWVEDRPKLSCDSSIC